MRLWDIDTKVCLRTFSGHTGQIICILFTGDGDRLITGSGDRTIKIWHVVTGDCLATLENHFNWVWSLSLVPDAQTLFSSSWDETINCWDMTTGQCRQTLRAARPYEGMIIDRVSGLTEAELATLKALGALEVN